MLVSTLPPAHVLSIFLHVHSSLKYTHLKLPSLGFTSSLGVCGCVWAWGGELSTLLVLAVGALAQLAKLCCIDAHLHWWWFPIIKLNSIMSWLPSIFSSFQMHVWLLLGLFVLLPLLFLLLRILMKLLHLIHGVDMLDTSAPFLKPAT